MIIIFSCSHFIVINQDIVSTCQQKINGCSQLFMRQIELLKRVSIPPTFQTTFFFIYQVGPVSEIILVAILFKMLQRAWGISPTGRVVHNLIPQISKDKQRSDLPINNESQLMWAISGHSRLSVAHKGRLLQLRYSDRQVSQTLGSLLESMKDLLYSIPFNSIQFNSLFQMQMKAFQSDIQHF